MTTVVSDTSPINYLILIGKINVLPQLFDEVLAPPAVYQELQKPGAPKFVFDWAAAPPSWFKVVAPSRTDTSIDLDKGEVEAISLALELEIAAVLLDEKKGRLAAEKRGIKPIGTLNILESAALRGLLDFEEAIHNLKSTNFRIDAALAAMLVARMRKRKET